DRDAEGAERTAEGIEGGHWKATRLRGCEAARPPPARHRPLLATGYRHGAAGDKKAAALLPPAAFLSSHIIVRMLRPYRDHRPVVDPSAYIDESAQVIGDVTIGAESSVWMNVVIRGDVNVIRIGARTNVQDGTVVHVMNGTHPTTIGDEVTIGHGAVVHGSTIADRVLVGMGAILLNGASIGSDS